MILHGRDILFYSQDGKAVVAAAKDGRIRVETEIEEVASATNADAREFRPTRNSWELSLNHLVTPAHIQRLLTVGSIVPVTMRVRDTGSLPFNGFVQGVHVEQMSPILTPSAIWWDTELEAFVAESSQGVGSEIVVSVEPGGGTFYRYGEPTTDNWCSKFIATQIECVVEAGNEERKFNLRTPESTGIVIASGGTVVGEEITSRQRWNISVPEGFRIVSYRIVAVLRPGQPEGTVFLRPEGETDFSIISAAETTIEVDVDAQSTYFETVDVSNPPADRQVWFKTFEIVVQLPPSKYYRSWLGPDSLAYIRPAEGALFNDAGRLYLYADGLLTAVDALGGRAIIRRMDISSPVGGLAKGSIELQGTGPLTAVE